MTHVKRKVLFLPIYSSFIVAIIFLTACTSLSAQETDNQNPAYSPVVTTAPFTESIIVPAQSNFVLPASPTTIALIPSETVGNSPVPAATNTPSASTPTALSPNDWMTLPVIPTVSQTVRSIYENGVRLGNNPNAFSKVGDCQSIPTYFLSYFDNPKLYNLGTYSSLQGTIDWYAGSFSRTSVAVKGGFNAAAILSPLRADPKFCNSNENPVACELRLNHPSIAIISLEEWWAGHPENYETYLRQIIEYTIQLGVVPIIATKADNLEGNYLINQTIADLAQEYDIPLWNFWAAVQSLPNHGLITVTATGETDMFHLTHSEGFYNFDDPNSIQSGWSVRNLTALQVLDAVRRGLSDQP